MTQNYVPRVGINWKTADMSIPYVLGNFVTGSTSIVVTPVTAPVAGDLLLVQIANTITLDPGTITPPAGWAALLLTVGSPGVGLWYKIATASEPASYTFTLPSSNWGWEYFNFRGVDVNGAYVLCPKLDIAAAPGTYTTPSFVIPYPGIALSIIGKSTTTAWDPSPGTWTIRAASGQAKAATRIYTDVDTSQTLTWALTPPGSTSTNLTHYAVLFLPHRIKH